MPAFMMPNCPLCGEEYTPGFSPHIDLRIALPDGSSLSINDMQICQSCYDKITARLREPLTAQE